MQLIVPDSVPPPVYITSFQVNNEELPINGAALQKAVTFTDTIRLRHHQSSFAIGFAALTYIAPEMTPYAYRLDGLDEQWTYLKTNRKVYFTDLSPGEYTFRVKTTNVNGEWLNNEARVLIIISPPFWFSPLAYFVYALIVLALIYIGVRSPDRVRHDHRRRDGAGPPARHGPRQRHRSARGASGDARGDGAGDAVRPPRARQAAPAEADPVVPPRARRHRRARDAGPAAAQRAGRGPRSRGRAAGR